LPVVAGPSARTVLGLRLFVVRAHIYPVGRSARVHAFVLGLGLNYQEAGD
jgi:hypothetical protein